MSKGLLKYGVTSYCPTLVTSDPDIYHTIVPKINKTSGGKKGANILCLHLEGPFISLDKKGAHKPESIRELTNVLQNLSEIFVMIFDIYGSFVGNFYGSGNIW